MNIELLSAEIARRVPAMAQDCAENNATIIRGLIRQELEREPQMPALPRIGRVVERRQFLKDYCRRNKITGAEAYSHLEKHAQALKASGFYAISSVTADIIYQLKNAAQKARND